MLPKHWVRGTPVTHDDLSGVRMSLPIEAHPAHPAQQAHAMAGKLRARVVALASVMKRAARGAQGALAR